MAVIKQKLKPPIRLDILLLSAVILLALFGLLMVFSTTGTIAGQKYGDTFFFIKRQASAVFIGLALLLISYRTPLAIFRRLALVCYPLAIILLLLTLIPGIGDNAGGAQRWINFGLFKFQPAEFCKFIFIIFLAGYFDKYQEDIPKFIKGIVLPVALVGLLGALLLAQPDFGSTAVIATITMLMSFSVGARLRYLVLSGLVLVLCAGLLVASSSYRMSRVMNYLNPSADAQGKGYQLRQSLIAVEAGQLTGVGIGESRQKLFYLPAAHTDFIYAVVAEELGFIGAVFVLLVFLFILWRGLLIAKELADDTFLHALAIGMTMLLVLPAIVNMGVVLGLLPTKGMVLPLVGYGGSNLVSSLFAAGVLLALGRRAQLQRF